MNNYTRSLGQRITILGRLFAKQLNEQIVTTGITGSQWSVITCLMLHDTITQSAICDQLSIEAPTISKTLAAMEQQGWITRVADDNDKREKKVALTQKAAEHLSIWTNIADRINQNALADIASEDIAVLDRVLNQVFHNFKKDTCC